MATPQLVHSYRLEDGTVIEKFDEATPALDAALVPVSLVVDTSVAASEGNVFKTLAEAATIRRQIEGPVTVTFRQATVHPALAYDFRDAAGQWNTTFTANGDTFVQQFAAGSTLVGLFELDVQFTFLGLAGSVFIAAPTAPAGFQVFRLRSVGALGATLGGDAFNAANVAGQTSVFLFTEQSGVFVPTSATLCARGANARILIFLDDGTTLTTSCLVESAAGQVSVTQVSAASNAVRTQAGLATTGPGLVPGVNLTLLTTTDNTRGPGGGDPSMQAGSVALVAGTTALIPATITATSRIPAPGIKTPVPGAGNLTVNYAPLGVDRVIGRAGAGGGFKLTALLADGTINVLDTSTLDWEVVN